MVRVTDMTHGRPIRLILLFSLPLMLGSVFQQLYTIVDTIIIGRGVGMQALASIGAADWINWLVYGDCRAFTQGFAILAAQEFGAGAYDRLRRVLAMIVKLSCWFGIAVTITSLLLVRPLLTLLHTDPAVFGGTEHTLYVAVRRLAHHHCVQHGGGRAALSGRQQNTAVCDYRGELC